MLDAAAAARWSWVGAPAGAGKTSIVSGWIETRALDCLWVQLDGGDADPASFFASLILAGTRRAGGKRARLPALTPEFLPGLALYARRFFEQLFGLFHQPFALVLDNFHEVPHEAALGVIVLPALLESLPVHGRLLCLSRAAPPPSVARFMLRPGFQQLGWDELSLTEEEALQLARSVGPSAAGRAAECNRWARGWIAGVKLLLRAAPDEFSGLISREEVAAQRIFDYYAQEVLKHMPAELRDCLQCAALLQDMEPEAVNALTGRHDSANVLAQLFEQRLFVERRLLPSGPSYQFHPLFRSFLLSRLASRLTAPQIAATKTQAAALLAARGQLEAATALALECGDPELLARLILEQAPQLAAQGRLSTLEHWILALPQTLRENHGWLQFWLGQGAAIRDLLLGRYHLERAYHEFQFQGDRLGAWLAVSSIIQSHFIGWGSAPAEILSRWLGEFESLRVQEGGSIPESIETQILALLSQFVSHCPDNPVSRHLAERARMLAQQLPDREQRVGIGGLAVGFLIWRGDQFAARALLEQFGTIRNDERRESLASLSLDVWRTVYLWTQSEHEECYAALAEARARYRRAGLGLFDPLFGTQLSLCAMSAGDHAIAGKAVQEVLASLQPFQATLIQLSRAMQAMQLALAGKTVAGGALARELLVHEISFSSSTGAMERAFLASALLETGALDEAERCALRALELAGRLPSERWMFEALMLLAGLALERGNEPGAIVHLREALALAARRDFVGGMSLFQPTRTARLLALAFRHGTEPTHVRRLIRRRRLAAPQEYAVSALWPVRLQVRTLGRFGVWIDDEPLPAAKSASRKPLEVLQALIGLGSADLSLATLGERLWPELDGAAAHNACHVAIHRLRKILKEESAVRIEHGMVSLNKADTWSDVEAFRVLAAQIRGVRAECPGPELEARATQLLRAYPGHFLPGEERPWVVGVRAQLRARFTHLAIELTAALERHAAHEAALTLNRHGIELDPLAEAFHRGLIRGLLALKRKAEALEAYRHCCVSLSAGLGVQPSAETRALLPLIIKL